LRAGGAIFLTGLLACLLAGVPMLGFLVTDILTVLGAPFHTVLAALGTTVHRIPTALLGVLTGLLAVGAQAFPKVLALLLHVLALLLGVLPHAFGFGALFGLTGGTFLGKRLAVGGVLLQRLFPHVHAFPPVLLAFLAAVTHILQPLLQRVRVWRRGALGMAGQSQPHGEGCGKGCKQKGVSHHGCVPVRYSCPP
jgi:hypothetical protein